MVRDGDAREQTAPTPGARLHVARWVGTNRFNDLCTCRSELWEIGSGYGLDYLCFLDCFFLDCF
jgi:hypothetical protein